MTERCLDAQLLAAFAERKLKRSEMPEVLAHLETCPTCMSTLKAAMDLMEPREQSRRWMAIAAAIAVLLGIAPLVRRALQTTPTEQLVRLAPKSARVVEARLSGGFAWAPYRGPMRSTDGATEAQRMKLVGAAGELVERADAEKSADAQHAAGIGLVLVEKPEDATARLQAATERAPTDARAWSDLAAAEYMTALRLGRASLYPVALAHADRALRIEPKSAEALFNRALILERLGLTQVAREAWSRYLEADPSSQWANEAREHLKRLPASTGESLFKREQPRLESAAARGDQATVDAIVARYRQQSRTWGEAEYLGRWGEAFQRGDAIDANRQLAIARAIGDSLVRGSGESLLRDAVAAIDNAAPAQRATIAEAHVTYRRGRMTYSRREPAAAEPDLRRAAMLFESAHDPMSLVARYFAANTRFDQNDVATARRELEGLREETEYAALGAQIRWELALAAMLDDDWSAAAILAAEAEQRFRSLGEQSNLAFMQTMLAGALISLGRPDEGWALRAKAFAIESGEGRSDRLLVTVGDAASLDLRTGSFDSARALLNLEESAHRTAANDALLSNVLVRKALVETTVGDPDTALRCAREAMTVAQRTSDGALRASAMADATFAAGAVALAETPRRAHELLSRSIAGYRAIGKTFYLPEVLLLRARASLRLGDRDGALRDLEEGIGEVERHRAVFAGSVSGTGVLDARRALFEEIIALQLDRGDVSSALLNAERTHRRLSWSSGDAPSAIPDMQTKLAAGNAAVLELVVLPRELIAFCVSGRDVAVSRRAVERAELAALASRGDDAAARELYDILIRPSEAALARVSQMIIVADRTLQQVPFAALFDSSTKRHLIEKMAVATAANASDLQPARRDDARDAVITMALPSGEGSGSVALSEGNAELADVAGFYKRTIDIETDRASLSELASVAMNAQVIHVAGHTGRQNGVGDAALLFRSSDGGVEPATWSRIASMKLGHPVVVLAACETLRAPGSPNVQTLSLGSGFLAAGATAVIGTLTPVADNEARELFRAVHRELSRGRGAVAALRHAQIQAIASDGTGRHSAWRAVAVMTSRIEPGI